MLASKKVLESDTTQQSDKSFERYAIYYVPSQDSLLGQFGHSWFGYGAEAGFVPRGDFELDDGFLELITQVPKRYGLHATLKAPFSIAEGQTLEGIIENLEKFSSNRKRFSLGQLKYGIHHGFLALVSDNNFRINQFASQCVLGFEEFRAPLTMKERTRRLEKPMTDHQRLMLEEHGYPYVLSEFHFHITLTSNLVNDQDQQMLLSVLKPYLDEICSTPTELDSIALVGDPGNGQHFELIKRFPLAE